MHHLVLLGDSILDNGSYTAGGPSVLTHVERQLPDGWRATLSAVDGSTTEEIHSQLNAIPSGATHLLLSVGGNNALLRADILETPVTSTSEALLMLSAVVRDFEQSYRRAVEACLSLNLPLTVCTVYHGNFPDTNYQQRVVVALTVFNDVIIRVATENNLKVIDLRLVCTSAEDYANPIEPSASGGAKIARAIVRAINEPACPGRGANIVAA
jgi:hypothetical protein